MEPEKPAHCAFVVKVEELPALNYLAADHPRPSKVEWINRGTDQALKSSSIEMLMRTLFQPVTSQSVELLHQSAGLRAVFSTEPDRLAFARALDEAKKRETDHVEHLMTAIFGERDAAERAIHELKKIDVPDEAVSLMWRASQFMDTDVTWHKGHSSLSVASAAAGGGIAGAILGLAILTIPGVGPVAAAGAIAASAFSSVGAVSGIIGATGGTIARMLTDHDVDGVSANYYAQQVQRGKIFVSVDLSKTIERGEDIKGILEENGGHSAHQLSN